MRLVRGKGLHSVVVADSKTKHVSPVWSAATPAARRGTLHIILTEEDGAALVRSPGEQKRPPQAASRIAPRNPSDLVGEVNSGGSNRRAITAAVTAQVASLDVSIAQTGMGLLCIPSGKALTALPACLEKLPLDSLSASCVQRSTGHARSLLFRAIASSLTSYVAVMHVFPNSYSGDVESGDLWFKPTAVLLLAVLCRF